MNNKLSKICLSVAVITTIAACASVESAKAAKGTGVEKTYNANCKDVVGFMQTVATSTSGKVKEVNNEKNYVLIEYGASAFSWGERVAVFCDQNGEKAAVEVVSIRAYSENITAKDWAPTIFEKLGKKFP